MMGQIYAFTMNYVKHSTISFQKFVNVMIVRKVIVPIFPENI